MSASASASVLKAISQFSPAPVIHTLDPAGLDHCVTSYSSAEPARCNLLAPIGKEPLHDLNMRLDEASGTVLAAALLKAADARHNGMEIFESAGVNACGSWAGFCKLIVRAGGARPMIFASLRQVRGWLRPAWHITFSFELY
jgi:hypothetical protein